MTKEIAIHNLFSLKLRSRVTSDRDALGIAIKALEQQPSDDCVSRKAVIDHINLHPYVVGNRSTLVLQIKTLPSVTPKAEWIPVSERLPKENEYIGNVCKYYLIQDEYGDMYVAHLSNVGWIPMDSLKAIGNEIIAWKELPQPYKAESEESEEDGKL